MQRLLTGVLKFRDHAFQKRRDLFEGLAHGQNPQALFITCSDSRICPSLITQCDPGDLFVVRNAGNLVAPNDVGGGEAASIEYAIKALKISDVIVCGHYNCGAMIGLLDHGTDIPGMDHVSRWLSHGEAARQLVLSEYDDLSRAAKIEKLVEANVLLQIEHLASLSVVAEALDEGNLDIHGWVYRIETGEMLTFDLESGSFKPIGRLDEGKSTGTLTPLLSGTYAGGVVGS
jgi:carbonic anhydrase